MVLTDSPGVVMVRSDYEKMLSTHGVASTADLLLPQTTADVKRLMRLAYKRPPPTPNFLLRDTLQVLSYCGPVSWCRLECIKFHRLSLLLHHITVPELFILRTERECL